MPDAAPDPPAFSFDGTWPFSGAPQVHGHPVGAVTSWAVRADHDGIPVVTLTLVGPGALRLLLAPGAAKVEVADESREALISLGWQPPAER